MQTEKIHQLSSLLIAKNYDKILENSDLQTLSEIFVAVHENRSLELDATDEFKQKIYHKIEEQAHLSHSVNCTTLKKMYSIITSHSVFQSCAFHKITIAAQQLKICRLAWITFSEYFKTYFPRWQNLDQSLDVKELTFSAFDQLNHWLVELIYTQDIHTEPFDQKFVSPNKKEKLIEICRAAQFLQVKSMIHHKICSYLKSYLNQETYVKENKEFYIEAFSYLYNNQISKAIKKEMITFLLAKVGICLSVTHAYEQSYQLVHFQKSSSFDRDWLITLFKEIPLLKIDLSQFHHISTKEWLSNYNFFKTLNNDDLPCFIHKNFGSTLNPEKMQFLDKISWYYSQIQHLVWEETLSFFVKEHDSILQNFFEEAQNLKVFVLIQYLKLVPSDGYIYQKLFDLLKKCSNLTHIQIYTPQLDPKYCLEFLSQAKTPSISLKIPMDKNFLGCQVHCEHLYLSKLIIPLGLYDFFEDNPALKSVTFSQSTGRDVLEKINNQNYQISDYTSEFGVDRIGNAFTVARKLNNAMDITN